MQHSSLFEQKMKAYRESKRAYEQKQLQNKRKVLQCINEKYEKILKELQKHEFFEDGEMIPCRINISRGDMDNYLYDDYYETMILTLQSKLRDNGFICDNTMGIVLVIYLPDDDENNSDDEELENTVLDTPC